MVWNLQAPILWDFQIADMFSSNLPKPIYRFSWFSVKKSIHLMYRWIHAYTHVDRMVYIYSFIFDYTYIHIYIYVYFIYLIIFIYIYIYISLSLFIHMYIYIDIVRIMHTDMQKKMDWLTAPSLSVISQRGGWWQKLMDRRRGSRAAPVCSIKWGILPTMMGINNLGKILFKMGIQAWNGDLRIQNGYWTIKKCEYSQRKRERERESIWKWGFNQGIRIQASNMTIEQTHGAI